MTSKSRLKCISIISIAKKRPTKIEISCTNIFMGLTYRSISNVSLQIVSDQMTATSLKITILIYILLPLNCIPSPPCPTSGQFQQGFHTLKNAFYNSCFGLSIPYKPHDFPMSINIMKFLSFFRCLSFL